MILPPPALRLLARRKLRGAFRKQVRRLRSPSGAIFAAVGFVVLGAWLASIVASALVGEPSSTDPELLRYKARFWGLLLLVLSLSGSLNHRGLYLPKEEIEPLFSAPVSRSDLVRYRLFVHLGRSAFASLFLGLLVLVRTPNPLFGFVGVFLGVQTLGVVGQAAAISSGAIERRFFDRVAKGPALFLVYGLLLFGLLLFLADLLGKSDGGELGGLMAGLDLGQLAQHPVVARLSWPFEPWAQVIAAESLGAFLAWSALCVALWVLAVELTARLPVDFRELSLETSASVAERIRRHRRSGGGASASSVSRAAAGWRVPWLFGRGPLGALAWRKSVSIVRKARGTFFISIFVLGFLTLLATVLFDGETGPEVLGGSVLIATLGTVYLCGGLRFDFREDLDRMESIKTWPVPPARIFAACLLPQVALVAVLLSAAILARAGFTGSFHPGLLGVLGGLPLLVMAWVAIDNVVFLLAPVRFAPGQEGTLQNAGRAMVLMFLRALFLFVVGIPLALVWMLLRYALEDLVQLDVAQAAGLATAAAALLLALVDGGLIWLGGRALRRFDVARDRG